MFFNKATHKVTQCKKGRRHDYRGVGAAGEDCEVWEEGKEVRMKIAMTVLCLCVAITIFNLGQYWGIKKSYKQLSRLELAAEIRTIGQKIEPEYPAVASILYTVAGTVIMENEKTLLGIIADYSEYMVEKLE